MTAYLKKIFAQCMIAYLESRRDAEIAIARARLEGDAAPLERELERIDSIVKEINDAIALKPKGTPPSSSS